MVAALVVEAAVLESLPFFDSFLDPLFDSLLDSFFDSPFDAPVSPPATAVAVPPEPVPLSAEEAFFAAAPFAE